MHPVPVMDNTVQPFLVFPEEVWDFILERVEEPQDIQNVISALPQLEILLHGKQCSWFIGTIIPLIFPKYLHFPSIMSCRLVSKRWRSAVDRTLQGHPDRFPYKRGSQQGIVTESHFNYARLPNILTDYSRYVNSVAEHNLDLELQPVHSNPFPGERVYISWSEYSNWEHNSFRQNFEMITACVIAFHPTDDNIVHFELEETEMEFTNRMVPLFYQLLSSMPNLKLLRLSGYILRNMFLKTFLDLMHTKSLPFRLDTLELFRHGDACSPYFKGLVKTLVDHADLKKFFLSDEYWASEFGTLVPNLCELSLNVFRGKETLQGILQDVSAANLQKLSVKIRTPYICVSDVLELLKSHQIKSLEIYGNLTNVRDINDGSTSNLKRVRKSVTNVFSRRLPLHVFGSSSIITNMRDVFMVPSIKHLTLEVYPPLSFHFLKSLPCQQYLTIEFPYWTPCVINCKRKLLFQGVQGKSRFGECLGEFYCNVFHNVNIPKPRNFAHIWDELTSL